MNGWKAGRTSGRWFWLSSSSVAVGGAGVFGAWIAYTLRRAGHAVTLFDPYGVAHSRASSGGESRIIRCSYGVDEIYTRMAQRSQMLWNEFFAATGNARLFERTGVLWLTDLDDEYAVSSCVALRKANVEFEVLSNNVVAQRYRQIDVPAGSGAIFEPNAGALMARQAVRAVVEEFVRIGGVYEQRALKSPSEERETADILIYACGPWLGKVFPEIMSPRLFVTRQEIAFFGIPAGDTRFQAPQMPIWLEFKQRGMYGFPDLDARGFKVACDTHGPIMDPDQDDRLVSEGTICRMRAYVAERFPALKGAPVVDARVCQYENTSSGDFIIDRHPERENVWLVGGGSGHGFKHGPAIGEYVCAMLNNGGGGEARFGLAAKKTTPERAVF